MILSTISILRYYDFCFIKNIEKYVRFDIMTLMKKINLTAIYFVFFALIITIIFPIFAMLFCIILRPFNKAFARKQAHKVSRLWGISTMALVFPKIKIEGSEYYDKNKTYIITLNHQSAFDIFLSFKIFNGLYSFVAKDVLFKIPFIGLGMKLAGYIPVKRGTTGAIKSIKDMCNRLSNNSSILIFPEGTRSYDGEIKFPKKGILKVSEQFPDIEILPVVVYGTKNIMRAKSLYTKLFQKINIRFLPPYKMKDIKGSDKDKLMFWYNIMSKNYEEIRLDKNN